jgi:subtilisin family serine protease
MRLRRLLAFLGVSVGLVSAACQGDKIPTGPVDAPADVPAPSFSVQSSDGLDVSDQYLVELKGRAVDFAEQVEALGGTVLFQHDIGIAWVGGMTPETAAELGALKSVKAIQQDAIFELDPLFDESTIESADAIASPDDPTTASRYARQWNMRAIEADMAWARGRLGSPGVTIAILDTGIDYLYPDLASHVDLSRSVSFVPFDDFLVGLFFPARHPVTDLHFHGTHVAMIASSNSDILAGVTTQTTLMGVKVCSVLGTCPFGAVIAGILHAADNGADVANMSLGGAFTKAGSKGLVGFINRTFNYAKNQGMTIVVSAGNDAADLDHNGNEYATYCDTPAVICVSATGPTAAASVNGPWTNVDAPASYTNFGNSAINVAAPGGTGASFPWSLVWSACSTSSLLIPDCQTGIFILGVAGTSQAAPHVSGLAALVVEDVGRRPGRVKTKIQQGADDLGKKGNDPYYGKGRINVDKTVN